MANSRAGAKIALDIRGGATGATNILIKVVALRPLKLFPLRI